MTSFPTVPLRRVAQVTLGKMLQSRPTTPTDVQANYLRAAHVQPGGRLISFSDDQTMWFSADELRRLDLLRGDVVVVEGGAGFGRSAHIEMDMDGWGFQNSIVRLRPRAHQAEGRFLNYALQSALQSGLVSLVCSTATFPHFTAEKVSAFPLPSPPMGQQRRIADFLDYETAQIDALIEKQEGLVTLLRERRGAALWQGVLQQSSLDRGTIWFGLLPPGWIADKLGRRTRIVNGSTPSRTNMDYWTDGIHPWLNSSFANEDVIREADQFVTDTALAECHLPRLERGAVLVGITGQGKTRGMAAQLEMQATINQHLAAVVPDDRHWDSRYLTLLLRSAYEQLRFISDESGSTKGALTCADLHAFIVPRPSLDEQVQIAARTDSETESTDELISRAERFILLSHERRAALITAAVTGQLDVTSKEIA